MYFAAKNNNMFFKKIIFIMLFITTSAFSQIFKFNKTMPIKFTDYFNV